jgi:hypothetical protein
MKNIIVYDLEIIKAIPPKDTPKLEDIEYCDGWNSHADMGISVIGAYDFGEDRYRVFTKDNWGEFAAMSSPEFRDEFIFAGFNSIPFDNKVLNYNGIVIPEIYCYDLLREIWRGAGLGERFEYPSHAGYGLDAVAKANGISGKTGNGALAPVYWQRGQIGTVIDYCLQDVAITAKLIKKVIESNILTCPKTGKDLWINAPA